MIYILTGVAKSGKSTITKKFHQITGIPYFCTDYLMMMVHYSKQDTSLDIDASDSSVSKKIEPYVKGLIRTMIENNETYIIEGVHFNTNFAQELTKMYPNDTRILYLGYRHSSIEKKLNELKQYKSVIPNQWYAKMSHGELYELVTYLIEERKRIYNECQYLNIPYVEITELQTQIDEVINLLLKKTN